MHYIVFLLLSAIIAPAPIVFASEQLEEPLSITPVALPIKYDNVIETVSIDNELYQVPEPWTGNRQFPLSRNLDELRQIPKEYTHQESEIYILAEAYPSLVKMLDQAHLDGIDLKVESAYRSIHYQTRIFVRMLKQGRTFNDIIRYVAPPGYSQHMLGTAMDFYPSNWEFAETEQYRWLQENGGRFYFEETYSKNNRFRMPWEAWHWNYIGEPKSPGQTVALESGNEKNKSEFPEAAQSTVTDGTAGNQLEAELPGTEGRQFEAELPEADDRG